MRKLIVIICCLFANPDARADIIAQFDFDGLSGSNAVVLSADLATSPLFAPTTADANASSSHLTVGAGFNAVTYVSNATNGDYLLVNENRGLNDGTGDDIDQAHDTHGDYFEFTVTAEPSFALDLDDLSFEYARGNNGTNDFGIRTSVDGFAANVFFGDNVAVDGAANLASGLQTVDLSAAEFQGLTEITFRIVLDDRQGDGSSSSAATLDDITVNGTVNAVPEPSSCCLLGLGVAGLVNRRRKSQKAKRQDSSDA